MDRKSLIADVSQFINNELDHENNEDGFTLRDLYTEFCTDRNGIDFDEFKNAFYACNKNDIVYCRNRRRWITDNVFLNTDEHPETATIDVFLTNLVNEAVHTYLASLVDTELAEVLRPILKEFVKHEFEQYVMPAVVKNLKQYMDEKIAEAVEEIKESLDEKVSDVEVDEDKIKELVNDYVKTAFNMQ